MAFMKERTITALVATAAMASIAFAGPAHASPTSAAVQATDPANIHQAKGPYGNIYLSKSPGEFRATAAQVRRVVARSPRVGSALRHYGPRLKLESTRTIPGGKNFPSILTPTRGGYAFFYADRSQSVARGLAYMLIGTSQNQRATDSPFLRTYQNRVQAKLKKSGMSSPFSRKKDELYFEVRQAFAADFIAATTGAEPAQYLNAKELNGVVNTWKVYRGGR